jgi:hypothetical protein
MQPLPATKLNLLRYMGKAVARGRGMDLNFWKLPGFIQNRIRAALDNACSLYKCSIPDLTWRIDRNKTIHVYKVQRIEL